MNKRVQILPFRLRFASSIQAKLVSALLVLTVVPLLLLGVLVTRQTEQVLTERISQELRVEVGTAAEALDVSFKGSRRDLLFLAEVLQHRLQPTMSDVQWHRLEGQLLETLPGGRGTYQIRILDASGREVLGFDKRNGSFSPVPIENLKDRERLEFFQAATRLPLGEIHLSGFALPLADPHSSPQKRLISRMATPVVDRSGKHRGVLETRIFASELLEALGPLKPIAGIGVFLIDDSDRYFALERQGPRSIFHVDNRQQLKEALGFSPPLPRDVAKASVRQGDRHLIALAPVHPLPGRQWLLAKSYPKAAIFRDIFRLRLTVLALALPLIALVTLLAILTARRFTRPVRELSRFAEAVAGGDYDRPVAISGRDEVGHLAQALREMGRSLAESRNRLLNWNRTLQEEVTHKVEALRESEEKYSLIFSAESDAILIVDAASRKIVDANVAAESLYGYDKKEFLRLRLAEISSEMAKSDGCLGKDLAGEPQTIRRVLHRRRNGSVFPAEVSAGTFTLNGQLKLVCIVRDITERQKIEELKDEMLSAVSHEMRTPLTAMLGFAEYLRENEVDAAKRREYLDIILKECDRLKELVDNLLTLQRLRAGFGQESFSPVVVATLLQEVARSFAKPGAAQRLRIDCPDGLPPVQGDQVQLVRALENLVGNALKYSPAETPVILGARAEEDGVTFWIRDQGPGIPEEMKTQIFDRYFRIDFRDGRRLRGTGLGLPLAKEVAKVHDGRVWVEAGDGGGSLFCLFIPTARGD